METKDRFISIVHERLHARSNVNTFGLMSPEPPFIKERIRCLQPTGKLDADSVENCVCETL